AVSDEVAQAASPMQARSAIAVKARRAGPSIASVICLKSFVSVAVALARVGDNLPEARLVERGGDKERADQENRRSGKTERIGLCAVTAQQRGDVGILRLHVAFQPGHVE